MNTIEEWRVGRNFVRVGDTVKVTADPGRRNGHEAKVRSIEVDDDGEVITVHVVSMDRGFRSYRPERIRRVAQTRHGERLERCR